MPDPTQQLCSIDGCDRRRASRQGWCSLHRKRWERTGSPEGKRRKAGPCSVEGCSRPLEKRGWCGTHYARWRTTGTVELRSHEPKMCLVDACGKPVEARGWCSTHYARWKKTGTTDLIPRPPRPACSVAGCDTDSRKRGYCDLHYRRWSRTGDPTQTAENQIPLPVDNPHPGERWLPVVGYEGLYEVSDHGRVRSLDRYIQRKNRSKPVFLPGRLKRQYSQPDGRPSVNLAKDGHAKTRLVPTLVLIAFVGPRPAGLDGCHNDGDASNNRVTNLRWDTRSANCYDRVRHGRDHKRNRPDCPRGHLLAAPNLIAHLAAQGLRGCLACSRARAAEHKARRAGRPFDFQAVAADRYAKIMSG